MFEITYQNIEEGVVVVEDINFGLRFEFKEPGFARAKVVDDYDLDLHFEDGTIKKVPILQR